MSIAPPRPRSLVRSDPGRTAAGRASTRAGRDSAVDLVRAWCLVVVVLLHASMVGVSVGSDGPVLENALEGWPGLPPLTWLLQVMPLFFVLGGFSSFTQWSRQRSQGARYGDYLSGRLRRLLPPAIAAAGAAALVLAGLQLAGVPDGLVAVAGFRLSQPLWFLGVYLLCTVAAPGLIALHRRAPVVTLAGLAAGAVAVEVVRAATGLTAVGYGNLLFVWLTVQQLGFWLADGRLDGLGRARVLLGGAGALGLLVVLCSTRCWSPDMLANLNPPTTALLALAAVQLSAFVLLRPLLRRVAAVPSVAAVVRAVGERAMTIYSWHMLGLIGLAGMLLLGRGGALPVPLSPDWWLTRPLWLVAAAVVTTALVAVAGRAEAGRATAGRATASLRKTGRIPVAPASLRALTAALTGAAGVLVILVTGGVLAGWLTGAALLLGGLRILRSPVIDGPGTR